MLLYKVIFFFLHNESQTEGIMWVCLTAKDVKKIAIKNAVILIFQMQVEINSCCYW